MSITDRLLTFSLGALAIVLVAFSVSVYLLVAAHSSQQLEDRAASTLDTLAAQCRWQPDGLRWSGENWNIQFSPSGEAAIWGVFDDSARCLETSRDLTFPIERIGPEQGLSTGRFQTQWLNQPWIVFRRRLVHSEPGHVLARVDGKQMHNALTVVTAWPCQGVIDTKRNLARFLCVVSLATWTMAMCVGRWYCNRALMPLSEMATKVRSLDVADLSFRLQERRTADELQDLTRAFDDLMDRLEEAFLRQSRFVSEASHQLRTPLAALLGQIEVALRRDRDASEYRRTLQVTHNVAMRLQKIVETLLFLARREGSGPLVELDPLDLKSWIPSHLRQNWADHPRYAEIRWIDSTDEPVIVRTHSAMLGQAIDNYLDNAMKYAEPGSPVSVRLAVRQGHAVIAVEDRGPGLDGEVLAHVFEPFYRSDEARRRGIEGLGLGLAIVARLAKAISAEIGVVSRSGQGSTFRIELELGNLPESDILRTETQEDRSSTSETCDSPIHARNQRLPHSSTPSNAAGNL